jgi:asparagine synthase (glutamine-hydrolysing)
MNEPFLHIRRVAGGFDIRGQTECALGHKIQNPARTDVDGIFVEWAWDGSCLRVRNDRYGFYPAYYYADSDQIAISTSIHRLLESGASRNLDDVALAIFLYFGSFIGEDTPFREIKALPPNATLEWRDGRLKVAGRITIPKKQTPSRSSAIDSYISLFRASVARRLPNKPTTVAPLSGGRDSRHITLELCRQGARPDFCLTADYYAGLEIKNEIRPASLICEALGLKHVVVRQSRPRINAEALKNHITGFTAGITQHVWILAIRDYLARRPCAVYDGIGGDVLSASSFLSEERAEWVDRGDYRRLCENFFDAASSKVVEALFNREMARRLNWDAAFERFREEFLRHANAPNPVSSFYFWNRTRRHIALAPYALLGPTHDVYSPYLDNDLFDFLASLPARMLVDRTFHTEAIHRAFPHVSHIPWAIAERGGMRRHRHYMNFAREALRYLLRNKTNTWLRRSYLVPRLIRCLLDPGYSPHVDWIGAMAVFLAQLEGVVRGDSAREYGLPDLEFN